MAETPAQRTARLQAEAREIQQQRLHAERSKRSTGVTTGKPAPKKPASLFEAITGALKGGK